MLVVVDIIHGKLNMRLLMKLKGEKLKKRIKSMKCLEWL